MPIYTNKYGLPDVIVRAIENDPYDSGDADISTTRLINPPQLVELARRYAETIEVDYAERMWSLLGQCLHTLLERAAPKGTVVEKRFFAEMDGWKIGGQVDLVDGKVLVDNKMTSVWTVIYGSRIPEWEAQANINAWLLHKNGVEVSSAENYAVLRDWVKSKADKEGPGGKYPSIPFQLVPLSLWPVELAERYIKDRVALHKAARGMTDEDLARSFPCAREERWWNDRQKVFIRCEDYCEARSVCKQRARERRAG
jgi:hypothetical protein